MNNEILVIIGDDEVIARQGEFTDKASGEVIAYDTRKQPAKVEAGGYAYPGMIPLEKGQAPYAPGRYVMRTDRMITCDSNGRIGFRKFPSLAPVK